MRTRVVGSVAVLLAAGCSSILEPGDRSILLPITKVEAPSTAAPGAGFSVAFTVQSGGCKRFERLVTTKTGTALTAIAQGTEAVGKNIVCTADMRHDTVVEAVTAPAAGSFSVVARQPDGTETRLTVQIQ